MGLGTVDPALHFSLSLFILCLRLSVSLLLSNSHSLPLSRPLSFDHHPNVTELLYALIRASRESNQQPILSLNSLSLPLPSSTACQFYLHFCPCSQGCICMVAQRLDTPTGVRAAWSGLDVLARQVGCTPSRLPHPSSIGQTCSMDSMQGRAASLSSVQR